MKTHAKHFRKRDAILTCLRETDCHPSAEWIFNRLKPQIEDLSLGTVYRNLALFKEQGLAISVGTVNGIERFDGNTAPHVHHICTTCGEVKDLHGISVPAELSYSAAQESGAEVSGCQLTFTGKCKKCIEQTQIQNIMTAWRNES